MNEWTHLGVGSDPPPYILDGSALQALHPEGPEQHGVEGWSQDTNGWQHCLNVKCGHHWSAAEVQELTNGGVTCPQCGYYTSRDRLERMGETGGTTKSGLSMTQAGQIAEAVVNRMGEIPGVGAITWRSTQNNFPIDLIVTSQTDGVQYGCEVKSIHSQSKGVFWAGTPRDIKRTLAYCMQQGLKPALIGVRLNFFNDKANVFFRTGLSNTWIGNAKMSHIATVDFSDLNPFQTPEQKDALLKSGPVGEGGQVDTTHPNYDFESDLDSMFGPKVAWDESQHPRDIEGRFVAKRALHEIKVKGRNGKHSYTLKRCMHCGFVYKRDADHQGRIECPTCGADPDRKLHLTKVVIGRDPVRDAILNQGWAYMHRTNNGHHAYGWTGPDGTRHTIITGNTEQKGHSNPAMEWDRAQRRMQMCMGGECNHAPYVPPEVEEGAVAGTPLIKAGQEVKFGDGTYWVMEIDGSLALIYDGQSGAEDVVPVTELQAVAAADDDPQYMFVAYNGKLIVEPWHHNLRELDLVERLLGEIGMGLDVEGDVDPADVVIGVLRHGQVRIDSATRPEANEAALEVLLRWEESKRDEWQTLRRIPEDWQAL